MTERLGPCHTSPPPMYDSHFKGERLPAYSPPHSGYSSDEEAVPMPAFSSRPEFFDKSPSTMMGEKLGNTIIKVCVYALPYIGNLFMLMQWLFPTDKSAMPLSQRIRELKREQVETLCWLVAKTAVSLLWFSSFGIVNVIFRMSVFVVASSLFYKRAETEVLRNVSQYDAQRTHRA